MEGIGMNPKNEFSFFRENRAIISGEMSLNKRDVYRHFFLLTPVYFPANF
jgi:hypothetical protein